MYFALVSKVIQAAGYLKEAVIVIFIYLEKEESLNQSGINLRSPIGMDLQEMPTATLKAISLATYRAASMIIAYEGVRCAVLSLQIAENRWNISGSSSKRAGDHYFYLARVLRYSLALGYFVMA